MGVSRRTTLTIIATLVLALSGCGQDGDDGESFVAYSWPATDTIEFLDFVWYRETQPEEFRERHGHVLPDPAFPDTDSIENGQYREATIGHWGTAYLLSSGGGGGYWATYEIFIEKGEKAQLFSDGADGDDLYFELVCDNPAQFHVWESPIQSTHHVPSQQKPLVTLGNPDYGDSAGSYSFRNERFRIVFRYGRIAAGSLHPR